MDGETFDQARDGKRLNKQQRAVTEVMLDGKWRTLKHIAMTIGAPESSVSARLRDLRKPRYGGYIVERRYISNGLFEYRVLPPPEPTQQEIVYSDPRIATIAPVDAEVIAGQIVLHLFKRLTDGKQA